MKDHFEKKDLSENRYSLCLQLDPKHLSIFNLFSQNAKLYVVEKDYTVDVP